MTYTEFLKSHFGDDGSLTRVLEQLPFFYYSRWDVFELKKEDCFWEWWSWEFSNSIFYWVRENDLYNQPTKTQCKIAELLGWQE
jgi:hypothetical protein